MFARKSILAATALVTLGFAGSAMAQFDDTPFNGIAPSNSNNQRGGGFKPLDMRPYPGAPVRNYNTNPLTAEGAKTAQYQAEQRDLAAANNRNNNTFPQYDTDRVDYVDRSAVTASDRMEPTVVQPAVVQPTQTWKEEPIAMQDGIDRRFIKPADPAVISPDTKNNAGIDRTLAQDYNLRRYQAANEIVPADQVAFRDVSNHPIDSMNDPAFRGPVVDMNSNTFDNARTASEVITPEPVVEPTPVITPQPEVIPNVTENHQPQVWKGARAPNALDNTGNPLPEKTIFGKVGDVPSEPAPNHLPRP